MDKISKFLVSFSKFLAVFCVLMCWNKEKLLPTILRLDGYRFFFFSNESNEPPHIHVEFGDKLAKYWLEPVELASSKRVRSHELGLVRQMVIDNREAFLKAWHDHFDA